MIHRLEIRINTEGSKLAILSPLQNGESGSGYRIAGPKAWGGSRELASIDITEEDLITYITEYAPEIISKLSNTGE